MSGKMSDTLVKPRFAAQWQEYAPYEGQVFLEPSCTIPDQSMTIPEIIAKFTRTGMVPGTISMRDKGGNVAAEPESDPMDEWNEIQAAAAAATAANAAANAAEVTESERVAGPAGGVENELPNGGAGEAGGA